LNDTQGINPDIPEAKFERKLHYFLERFWYRHPWNVSFALSYRLLGSDAFLVHAPTVTEGYIWASLINGLE
jgi:hypothetical protein